MHRFADYARAALVLGFVTIFGAALYIRESTAVLLLIAGMLLAWALFRALNRISGGALLGDETREGEESGVDLLDFLEPPPPAKPSATHEPTSLDERRR